MINTEAASFTVSTGLEGKRISLTTIVNEKAFKAQTQQHNIVSGSYGNRETSNSIRPDIQLLRTIYQVHIQKGEFLAASKNYRTIASEYFKKQEYKKGTQYFNLGMAMIDLDNTRMYILSGNYQMAAKCCTSSLDYLSKSVDLDLELFTQIALYLQELQTYVHNLPEKKSTPLSMDDLDKLSEELGVVYTAPRVNED